MPEHDLVPVARGDLARAAERAAKAGLRAPDWLHNAVVDGLTTLYATLHRYRPGDAVEATVAGWLLAVMEGAPEDGWRRDYDERRVVVGFARLLKADRWPVPGHLLAAMPPCARRHAEALVAEAEANLRRQAWREERARTAAERRAAEQAARRAEKAGLRADPSPRPVDFRAGLAKVRRAVNGEGAA
jgi:hypothetical protein